MKEFHEDAHIIDKNTNMVVGMLLHRGGIGKIPHGTKSVPVSIEVFNKFVQEERIQYFVSDKQGRPIVHYTDEEIKKNRMRKHPELILTGQNYFDNDMRFYSDAMTMKGFNHVAISVIFSASLLNVKHTALVMYRSETFTEDEIKNIRKIVGTARRITDNMYLILAQTDRICKWLRNGKFTFSLNTDLHYNTNSMHYKKLPMGFKNLSNEDIGYINYNLIMIARDKLGCTM